MKRLLLILALLSSGSGCGATIHDAARTAAAGAVAGLTSPDSEKRLEGLAAGAAGAAAKSATDAALGPATKAELEAMVRSLGASLRQQVLTMRDDLLDSHELLWEIGQLREALLGAPLRADIDQMLDEVAPRLSEILSNAVTAALVPVREQADAASATWRTTAFVVGGAALALVLALGFAVHELRAHRKLLAAWVDPKIGDGGPHTTHLADRSVSGGRPVGFRR